MNFEEWWRSAADKLPASVVTRKSFAKAAWNAARATSVPEKKPQLPSYNDFTRGCAAGWNECVDAIKEQSL